MVPPYSHRVSRVRRYSGYSWLLSVFAYETLTLFGGPSHVLLLTFSIPSAVRTPKVLLLSVWPLPRSLATTCGISVDFFSSPYLDVSVQAVPHRNLWIQLRLTEYCSAGFPHSEIRGSMPICGSPQLIAACHVLRRLSVPRHSPCALYSLTCSSQSPLRSASQFTGKLHSAPLLLTSDSNPLRWALNRPTATNYLQCCYLQELGYISVEVLIS